MFKTKKPNGAAVALNSAPKTAPAKITPRAGVPSIISADMTIHGNLRTIGDLQIEGAVVGDIEAVKLVIADGGTVTGNIIAADVRICGCLTGSVRSAAVTLTASAQVIGDIHHEFLTIDKGGRLEGQSRRLIAAEIISATALEHHVAPEAPAAEPQHHWENGGQHDHHEHHHNGEHHGGEHHEHHHDEHHEHYQQ